MGRARRWEVVLPTHQLLATGLATSCAGIFKLQMVAFSLAPGTFVPSGHWSAWLLRYDSEPTLTACLEWDTSVEGRECSGIGCPAWGGVPSLEGSASLILAAPSRMRSRPCGSERLGHLLKSVQPERWNRLPEPALSGAVCKPFVCAAWARGAPNITEDFLVPSSFPLVQSPPGVLRNPGFQ